MDKNEAHDEYVRGMGGRNGRGWEGQRWGNKGAQT